MQSVHSNRTDLTVTKIGVGAYQYTTPEGEWWHETEVGGCSVAVLMPDGSGYIDSNGVAGISWTAGVHDRPQHV